MFIRSPLKVLLCSLALGAPMGNPGDEPLVLLQANISGEGAPAATLVQEPLQLRVQTLR